MMAFRMATKSEFTASMPGKGGSIPTQSEGGFTLVEMMVAVFVFAVIISMVFVSINRMESGAVATASGIHATDSAESVTNVLVTQVEGAVYPSGSDLSAQSQATILPLDSPVAVACPEDILFYASPPSPSSTPASPEWFWAFVTTVPGITGPLAANRYELKEIEFKPGNGYANTIYADQSSCPGNPPSSALISSVDGAGTNMPADSSSLYLDLSAGYNGMGNLANGAPEPQVFTYLNGNTGLSCPANGTSCTYTSNQVAAVGIHVMVRRRPLDPIGLAEYRVLLTAVGNAYCLPYANFDPAVCSSTTAVP
jgi:prepilin-type N-terminal cleavage/methylation domain-containing protein